MKTLYLILLLLLPLGVSAQLSLVDDSPDYTTVITVPAPIQVSYQNDISLPSVEQPYVRWSESRTHDPYSNYSIHTIVSKPVYTGKEETSVVTKVLILQDNNNSSGYTDGYSRQLTNLSLSYDPLLLTDDGVSAPISFP